jgi:hypothetical protein
MGIPDINITDYPVSDLDRVKALHGRWSTDGGKTRHPHGTTAHWDTERAAWIVNTETGPALADPQPPAPSATAPSPR